MSDNENANETADVPGTDIAETENIEAELNTDQSDVENLTEDDANDKETEDEIDKKDDEEIENNNVEEEETEDDEQRNQSSRMKRSQSRKSSHLSLEGIKSPDYDISKITELPEGCKTLFLSGPTLEIFDMKVDDSVSPLPSIKLLGKDKILEDLQNRAAVSDFSVLKNELKSYEGDEILLFYDHNYVFGENFIIAMSEKAKETLIELTKVLPSPGSAVRSGSSAQGEEDIIPPMLEGSYVRPKAKTWIGMGSDTEIKETKISLTRPLIKTIIQRNRKEFGASISFSTVKSVGYEEIVSYEDNSFCLKPIEVDKNESNAPEQTTRGCNTTWRYPRNAFTQYKARTLPERKCEEVLKTVEILAESDNALPYLIEAIQHNEITNYFIDDYAVMSPGDTVFDNKTDNDLKEFQTFADLKIGKEKAVTHVEWHPTIKGIVAASMAEKTSFDSRVDNYSRVILNPSYIVLWSFLDPIQPQLLLEAPCDVYCFQFNPTDPQYIAAGCYNGQLVIWDIEAHMDNLKNVKARMKSRNVIPLFAFDGDEANKIPRVRPSAVSHYESGHTLPILDLKWLPDHYEINNLGYSKENLSQKCVQLATAAGDHRILFWDIRQNKAVLGAPDKASVQIPTPSGIPETFKYLDMKWKPTLRVHLFKSGPGGDYMPTRFSLKEVQGDRRVLEALEDKENKHDESVGGTKPVKERTLQNVNTHIFTGTEDGEIVSVDWMPQKDQDSGKLQTSKPDHIWTIHDGPITGINRSPFDRELILVVGGWIWTLWKESVNSGPILQCCTSQKPLTGGAWSPTRSSVFFIIRSDGNVEIWDMLDKTHEPTLIQNISSTAALTHVNVFNFVKKQLMAIGDINGGLHVYEVPLRFKQQSASELNDTMKYIDREVKRRVFVQSRWNLREHEKIEKENEAKRKAGIAPQVVLSDEEIRLRMKVEYEAFLQEEQIFLRELGLKEDAEEDL